MGYGRGAITPLDASLVALWVSIDKILDSVDRYMYH